MSDPFDDVLEVVPAVRTLRGLFGDNLSGVVPEVRRALKDDDYSTALSRANDRYSSRGPEDPAAAVTYAVLLVGRHLIDEALGVIRRVKAGDTPDIRIFLVEAEALLVDGRIDEARSILESLEDSDELQPHQEGFVAELYLDMGDDEGADRWYRRALEDGLESRSAAWRLARMYSERGDDQQAAYYLAQAARFAGDDPQLWHTAAEACWEVGEVDEAIHCYERMLKDRPYDTEGWFTLGLSYWYQDRFEEAASAFEKVVDLNPHHRVALVQLGEVWLTIGRGEQALEAFRRALQLDADDLDALTGAAMAAHLTGDLQAAADWAKRAMELDEDHPDSRYTHAVVSLASGQAAEAYELLQPLVDHEEIDTGQVLGPLAVAALKSGHRREGFEHIDDLARLHEGQRWLAVFAAELLKADGVESTLKFIDDTETVDPRWQLVRPVLALVCAGLAGDAERARQTARQFGSQLDQHPQALPVLWDFEPWEAMAFRLDRQYAKMFDTMLAILEGRRRPEPFEDEFPG